MKLFAKSIAALAACVLVAGCGEPQAELVAPVTGTVTINDKPAAGIMVQFVPDITDESIVARTSQAMTDEDGKFTMVTMKNEPGAMPGPHRVTLMDTLEERPAQGEVSTQKPRLAGKFTSPGIKVTVKEGEEILIEATGPR